MGGRPHSEITVLVDTKLCVKTWVAVEDAILAAGVDSAIADVLHGLCGYSVADGTIVRAQLVGGPFEFTDPDTGWVGTYAFYQVMVRPNSTPSTGPMPDAFLLADGTDFLLLANASDKLLLGA